LKLLFLLKFKGEKIMESYETLLKENLEKYFLPQKDSKRFFCLIQS